MRNYIYKGGQYVVGYCIRIHIPVVHSVSTNEMWDQVIVVCHSINVGGNATSKPVQRLTTGTIYTAGLTASQPAATN